MLNENFTENNEKLGSENHGKLIFIVFETIFVLFQLLYHFIVLSYNESHAISSTNQKLID